MDSPNVVSGHCFCLRGGFEEGDIESQPEKGDILKWAAGSRWTVEAAAAAAALAAERPAAGPRVRG